MKTQTVIERTQTIETSIGAITIHELTFDDIQYIISDLFQLYQSLDQEVLSSGDGMKIFMSAVKNKELTQCIVNTIARSGDQKSKDVATLGIRDTLKLAKAFVKVNPVKETMDLFLELKDTVVGVEPSEDDESPK